MIDRLITCIWKTEKINLCKLIGYELWYQLIKLTLTTYTYPKQTAKVGNGDDMSGQSLVRGSAKEYKSINKSVNN